jgi:hypothetical protein
MGQFSVEKPVAPGSVLSGNQQLGLYPLRRGDQVAVFVDNEIGSLCSVV